MNAHRTRRIASFLVLYGEELAAARRLASDHPRQAIYFTQQALEKLIRAVIEADDGVAGTTHNIRALVDILPRDHLLRDQFLQHDDLSVAATRFRYPLPTGGLARPDDPEDIAERVQQIEEIAVAVRAYLATKTID